MSCMIGERVGAILGSSETEEKTIDFLGYGIYKGDFEPNFAVGLLADMVNRVNKKIDDNEKKIKNPMIVLDSGKVVWGCECWWGLENSVKERIEKYKQAGYKIKEIDIDEIRKAYSFNKGEDK